MTPSTLSCATTASSSCLSSKPKAYWKPAQPPPCTKSRSAFPCASGSLCRMFLIRPTALSVRVIMVLRLLRVPCSLVTFDRQPSRPRSLDRLVVATVLACFWSLAVEQAFHRRGRPGAVELARAHVEARAPGATPQGPTGQVVHEGPDACQAHAALVVDLPDAPQPAQVVVGVATLLAAPLGHQQAQALVEHEGARVQTRP